MPGRYPLLWNRGKYRKARKAARCDWSPRCSVVIGKGELYFDPAESNPDRAGGFGGYRYCLAHDKDEEIIRGRV